MSSALSLRPGLLSTNVVEDPLVNATFQADVAPGGGAGVIYSVQIDNTANAAQDVYFKLFNHLGGGGFAVGTNAAHILLKGPAGTTKCYTIPQGIAFGVGITYACVTTADTAGVTNPTNAVAVIMQIS
jgi:hypothetical protein